MLFNKWFALKIAPIVMEDIFPNYPKWKDYVPETPSFFEFRDAWKEVFDFYPEQCKILGKEDGINNAGLTVRTPKGIHSNGGLGEHTDSPILEFGFNFWYKGGISWSIDKENNRFYYIDKLTELPANWLRVYSMEVLRRYFENVFVNVPTITTEDLLKNRFNL